MVGVTNTREWTLSQLRAFSWVNSGGGYKTAVISVASSVANIA